MQSVIRTFKRYLDIDIVKDQITNTITMAQASRHALVHSLGLVDEKFIVLADQAKPRDIKQSFALNDKISFSASELEFVKLAMQHFISRLCEEIKNRFNVLT